MANALMEALSSGAQNELANKLRPRGFKYRDAQEAGLPSKNELLDIASKGADFLPVVGGVKGAYEEGKSGNYLMSALNAATVPLDVVSGGAAGAMLKAGLAGTFIGKGAKTWDAIKAADAEKRIAAGDDVRKVWKETGTFKGPDGHLRQEIDDSAANLRPSVAQFLQKKDASGVGSYSNVPLSDVFKHEKLSRAYPQTEGTLASLYYTNGNNAGGVYQDAIDRVVVTARNPIEAHSTTLHELQHGVQGREGWARGGSPDEFEDAAKSYRMKSLRLESLQDDLSKAINSGGIHPQNGATVETYQSNIDSIKQQMQKLEASGADRDPMWQYKRLSGEAEARATQARMNMNMEQRLNTYPLDSYDVPLNQLIFR